MAGARERRNRADNRTAVPPRDGYRRVMAPPVIMAVEGNPIMLDSVENELTERYARHYRIERARDLAAAAALLRDLAGEGADVALVLMGDSGLRAAGGNALEQARRLHPHAKRALLVSPDAWVDTERAEVIRAALVLGQVDHFVLEPGHPPDEVF